mgnify:CR=1 FL=1
MRFNVFCICLVAASLVNTALGAEAEVTGHYPAITLFKGAVDVLGRPLSYPECAPDIQVAKITMAPGQVGEPHRHVTPLFAYVLSGEISVTYDTGVGPNGEGVTRTYRAGDALMEAMEVSHYGFNATDEPVALLAVYMNCAP